MCLKLDGKRLEPEGRRKPLVLCYNKPISEVCSRDDPEKRKTVFESLPELKKWTLDQRGTLRYQHQWFVIIHQ